MRVVPPSRLLIQPTVQLKWLQQHGNIEFELDATVQQRFADLWQCFTQAKSRSLLSFLESEVAIEYELQEDDVLFALLTGADYIGRLHPSFSQQFFQPNLVWRINLEQP